ncbi:MAG: AbrB/MazE/SpoVT family DNA-binding domain-containing protein [Polyangiales bacterium]
MSKVTSKLQLTLPKALALRYGIVPGSEVHFEAAGDIIHLRPQGEGSTRVRDERVARWEQICTHQQERAALYRATHATGALEERGDRGWTRDELYEDR